MHTRSIKMPGKERKHKKSKSSRKRKTSSVKKPVETIEDTLEKRKEKLRIWKENLLSQNINLSLPKFEGTEKVESSEIEKKTESLSEQAKRCFSNLPDDNDVDPLDEYMTAISNEITQYQNTTEKERKIPLVGLSSGKACGSYSPEIIEKHQDLIINANNLGFNDDDEIDLLELANRKKNKKFLEPPDHNKIYYIPFKKDFYVEVPEIRRMTKAESISMRKEMENIKVRGKNVPKPIRKWAQLGLNMKIMDVLKKNNYLKPTPIQAQAIPCIMSGRDLIGIAKTGSGKTLGFLLPMFRHILDQPPLEIADGPIALIMTPTRELAIQTYRECRKFSNRLNLTVNAVYGGSTISEQISALKKGAEIIVCTPGRMIDMLTANNGKVTNCRRITFLVLDEADRMFDMGFEPQVMKIIEQIRPDRQTILFSATFPKIMDTLARKILCRPLEINVGGKSVVCDDVKQYLILLDFDNKFLKLLEILGQYNIAGSGGAALIFVEKQDNADNLLSELLRQGYPCLSLHGGMDQYDRDCTLNDFKNGAIDILIATSIAARGLDVKNLNLVVNYDCPNHYEDYVHRCGRTGRAGNKGTAITFIHEYEIEYAWEIIKSFKDQKLELPIEISLLYDQYVQNLALTGKVAKKKTGFGGRGYKFNESDDQKINESRNNLKWSLGMQNSDDEAEQEEKTINHLDAELNKAFSKDVRKGTLEEMISNNPELVEQVKKGNSLNQNNEQSKTLDASNENSVKAPQMRLFGRNLAKQLVDRINAKLNYTSSGKHENEPDSTGYFVEEIDINDFPQGSRWKITAKENLASIMELCDCAITVRGTYVHTGKSGDQFGMEKRLHLLIEATSEGNVHMAKNEIRRMLKEELMNHSTYLEHANNKYRVV